MEVRDAVEADADALAALADAPADVMRNLVHDRTVRVAEADDAAGGEATDSEEGLAGFVSFDARDRTVHVTQLGGSRAACERLLAEPVRFARREGMDVECLVPADDEAVRGAVEAVGFADVGAGPRFEGRGTVRYRLDPDRDEAR
jgi:hypothetical protein